MGSRKEEETPFPWELRDRRRKDAEESNGGVKSKSEELKVERFYLNGLRPGKFSGKIYCERKKPPETGMCILD